MPQVANTCRDWHRVAKGAREAAKYPYLDDLKRDRLLKASAYILRSIDGVEPRKRVVLDASVETSLLLVGICANHGIAAGDSFRQALQKLEPRPVPKPGPSADERAVALQTALAAEAEGAVSYSPGDYETGT